MELSIEEVRRLALANNLDLRVELINPAIARTALTEEEAQYEALFYVDGAWAKTDSPTASQLAGSQDESLAAAAGVQIPLRTVGVVQLEVPVTRFETDNEFSTLNPAYTSDFAASIRQPLLRGFGTAANTQRLRIAFYDYQSTQARTKLEVIRVLAAADRVYWRLFAAREALKVRRQEYDLASALLGRARRQVAAGNAAEVEILRSESGVADAVEAIITAENAVRDRQRELKRVLNRPGLEMETGTILIPVTEPDARRYRVDAARLADAALGKRMEMLELELQVAADVATVAAARNATLPLVTLDYTYNINGLGPTLRESFEVTGDKDFEDHRVGLRVEVPIGNEAARSRLRRAILGRLQTLATREQRALQIRQEVFNATDQLEANWQRILANRQRVLLAQRVLRAETRQFELGLRTSTEVLDAQASLADAQLSEIEALTEYQIAQIDIAFATGTLLGASRVVWEPTGAGGARAVERNGTGGR